MADGIAFRHTTQDNHLIIPVSFPLSSLIPPKKYSLPKNMHVGRISSFKINTCALSSLSTVFSKDHDFIGIKGV